MVRSCESSHATAADHGSLDTLACAASNPEIAKKPVVHSAEDLELERTEEKPEEMLPGPATLWGILLSETSPPKAVIQGLSNAQGSRPPERETIINTWVAAGYDCQLPEEYYANSPIVTNAMLIGDEESMQSYQSADPPIGPYIVKKSPGKGQGVFAARDVRIGERVLVEKPFFVVTRPYDKHKVLLQFERMPLPRRKQYMQLYCPDRSDNPYMTDVMRIFEANCFNIGDKAALFLTATRFNHSCLPNVYYSWSEKRNEIVFHSMINIPDGEEMTICYGFPFLACLERHSELRFYNFWCRCPACQTETSFGRASEARRLEMKALNEQIIMFQSNINEALMTHGLKDPLTAVFRLIEVIKEEGLNWELMIPYRSAADYLRGRGNIEDALEFAHLELEEEVVCFGDDSEIVSETIEYIEELERMLEEVTEEEAQEYDSDTELIRWQDETTTPMEQLAGPNVDFQPLEQEQESKLEEERPEDPTEDIPPLQTPLHSQPHLESEERSTAVAGFEAADKEIGASEEQQDEERWEETSEEKAEEPHKTQK